MSFRTATILIGPALALGVLTGTAQAVAAAPAATPMIRTQVGPTPEQLKAKVLKLSSLELRALVMKTKPEAIRELAAGVDPAKLKNAVSGLLAVPFIARDLTEGKLIGPKLNLPKFSDAEVRQLYDAAGPTASDGKKLQGVIRTLDPAKVRALVYLAAGQALTGLQDVIRTIDPKALAKALQGLI